jgi:hypothetical protein
MYGMPLYLTSGGLVGASKPVALWGIALVLALLIGVSYCCGATQADTLEEAANKAIPALGMPPVAESVEDIPNAGEVRKVLSAFPVDNVVRYLVGMYSQSNDPKIRSGALAALRILREEAWLSKEARKLILRTSRGAILDPDDTAALQGLRLRCDPCGFTEDGDLFRLRLKTARDAKLAEALLDWIGQFGDLETLLAYLPSSFFEQKDSLAASAWHQRLLFSMGTNIGSGERPHYAEKTQERLVELIKKDRDLACTVLPFIALIHADYMLPKLNALERQSRDEVTRIGVCGARVFLEKEPSAALSSLVEQHRQALAKVKGGEEAWPLLATLNGWIGLVVEARKDRSLLETTWAAYKSLNAAERASLLTGLLSATHNSEGLVVPFLAAMRDRELQDLFKAHPPLVEELRRSSLAEFPVRSAPKDKWKEFDAIRERLRKLIDEN